MITKIIRVYRVELNELLRGMVHMKILKLILVVCNYSTIMESYA